MSALTSAPAIGRDRAGLSRRITRDSLWLLSGYAVTAGSGFLFWILAARLVPPALLGIDTAILSIVAAAAAISSSGIGNGLMVMLQVAGAGRRALVRTAMRTVLLTSTVVGILAGLIVATTLPLAFDPVVTVVAVAAATVILALFSAQSPALVGLGSARSTLFVNGPVNLAKLALLPVMVVTVGSAAQPVVFATLFPAAVATVIVSTWLLPRLVNRGAVAASVEPAHAAAGEAEDLRVADVRRRFFAYVKRDGPATGVSVGVGLSLAFIVTALAGPAEGAVFALCYQFSVVLDLVAVGFGTSLAVHAAADHDSGRALAFRTWKQVAMIVAVVGGALIVGSPLLFLVLGDFYAASGGHLVLGMLAVACLLRTPWLIWGALLRAEQKAATVLLFNTMEAAVLVPLVVLFTVNYGAQGAAGAVLIVGAILAVVGAIGTWGRRNKRGTL